MPDQDDQQDDDHDPGLLLRATSRISRRIGLGLTKVLGRLGLIKVPYGDYQAAQGRRDPSRGDDAEGNG